MNGRERIEAAFSSEGTLEFAAVIPYESILVRDHWDQLTECPWWYVYETDIERQMMWRRDLIGKIGQDWFDLPSFPSREEREWISLEERSGEVFRINKRSGVEERLERPGVSGLPDTGECVSVHPRRLCQTPEEIEAAIPVPPAFDPRAFRKAGRADLADRLLEEFGNDLFPLGYAPSPLWFCYGLWGFEGMMTMVVDRPDLIEMACGRILAHAERGVREAAACGAAGIWIEECMTDMIDPEAFGRLSIPFVRRLVETIRELGMRTVYYFCGNPPGKWDLILSAGADAVSFEEAKKGFRIDIEDVVARVNGRCAVLGNLDAINLLERGCTAELKDEIASQIRAGRRNRSRFIMSLGSPVTPGTGVDRVREYTEMVHEMGGG